MNLFTNQNEKPLFIGVLGISLLCWGLVVYYFQWAVLLALIFGGVFYIFFQSAVASRMRGMGVLISATQFPDIHECVLNCANKIGMQRIPEVFIMNGNGVLNTIAARFIRWNGVVLLSDLVDAIEDKPDVLSFYIGHEMGRIHRRYLVGQFLLVPGVFIPLLGAAYLRAREYTCDQYGVLCSDKTAAQDGVALLAAGARRYRALNEQAYRQQAQMVSGFWMSFHELISAKPWLVKRFHAISSESQAHDVPKNSRAACTLAVGVPYIGMMSVVVLYALLIADIIVGQAKEGFDLGYNTAKLAPEEILARDVKAYNARIERSIVKNATKFIAASIEGDDTLVYHYDISLPLSKINVDEFITKKKESDKDFFCNDDDMEEYRDRDLRIISRYRDSAGELVGEIVTDNAICLKKSE